MQQLCLVHSRKKDAIGFGNEFIASLIIPYSRSLSEIPTVAFDGGARCNPVSLPHM